MKKTLLIPMHFLAMCIIIAVIIQFWNVPVIEAASFETDNIEISSGAEATITNADAETITVDKNSMLSGTMEILKDSLTDQFPLKHDLTVRSSSSYKYEKKGKESTSLLIYNDEERYYASLDLNDVGSAFFDFLNKKIDVTAPKQKYELSAGMNPNGPSYTIEGTMNGTLSVIERGNQFIVNGAKGKTNIEIEGFNGKPYLRGSYYLFGKNVVLTCTSNKAYIKNAVKLQTKTTKHPIALYLRPVNGGQNMAISWTKVKKAKSYVIYRYDAQAKKYKREEVRNGFGANYYITGIYNTRSYRYKVMAMTGKNGKGKRLGKLSYDVSAVPLESDAGNATEVKVNASTTLKVKKGKSRTLKATALTTGKKIYDSSIRWYSSNKRIVKIGNRTGKMTFGKKGKCYIWAKAHNGVNSKKIKVVVR